MVVTEVLIVLKFDLPLVLKVPPTGVIVFWAIFCLVLLAWTIWFFFVRPYRKYKRKQLIKAKKEKQNQRSFSNSSTYSQRKKMSNEHEVTRRETTVVRPTTNGRYSTRLRSRLSDWLWTNACHKSTTHVKAHPHELSHGVTSERNLFT